MKSNSSFTENPSLKVTMEKKQLTDAGKGRALGLIEDAGWSISDVAKTLGVSRWTIMRLIARKKQNPESEVPRRKQGTGPLKKYGKKEIDAIEALAKLTQAYLKKENLKSLLLPGKSPDLNPIENCFCLLKRKL